MDYTLAKELERAGFPQIERADEPPRERSFLLKMGGKDRLDIVFAPTLSELIEACGDEFFELVNRGNRDGNNWYCSGTSNGDYERFEGTTPEEAVAKLWLALNKK